MMGKQSTNLIAIIAAAIVLVLCVGVSAAQLVRPSPSNADRVYDFTVSESRDLVTWHAFGREWTVRLELSDVVEDNMDYYHGTLDGDVNAVVSFALLPGTGLSGMIITGGNTWWVSAQPLPERGFSEDEDKLGIFMTRESHSVLDESKIPQFSEPLSVSNVAAEPVDANVEVEAEAGNQKRVMSSYKVAVFFDQNYASPSINPWYSQANTIGIFNDVNAVYKAAGLNTFSVVIQSQINNAQTTLNEMLTYFSSRSLSAFTDKTYTNYVWLVGKNVGGLAYIGTTCQGSAMSQNQKTAVTGLVNYSRLWTVKTIAHELGHNRGAQHYFLDACTSSVTSGCQCSVMSYCFPAAYNNPLGAVNYFHSVSINQMKAAGCY